MTHPELTITTLFETDDLLVRRGSAPDQTGVPLVIFSCAQLNAISGEWLEFYGFAAKSRRPVIWVTDKARSWFGAPGLADAATKAILTELSVIGAPRVDTLGGSMGGYGAVAFSRRLPVRRAVAFVPRFSADPTRVRDFRLRDHLMAYRTSTPFPAITEGLGHAERTLILHGNRGVDLLHITAFPDLPNVWHQIMPGAKHNVAPSLKAKDMLTPLLRAALGGPDAKLRETLAKIDTRPLSEMRQELLLDRDDWIEKQRPKPLWLKVIRAPLSVFDGLRSKRSAKPARVGALTRKGVKV